MHEAPDRAQVVKTFGKEAADFIELAASLGWKCVFNNTGTSVALIPHTGDAPAQRIHLSSRNKGGGLMRKYAKRLAKGADQRLVNVAVHIAEDDKMTMDEKQAAQLSLGKMFLEEDPEQRKVLPAEPKKERFVKPAAVTPAAVAEKVKKERHVISERPALMHYSLSNKGGQSYPSKTTIERRWSDGAVDYVCAVPTCDAGPRKDRRSFGGSHWAMHVRKGEAEPVDVEEMRKNRVDDPSYTETAWSRKQTYRDKRVADLTEMLKAVDLKSITPEDLAAMLVEFLSDDSGGGGGNSEPLTDEQIIDKIRTLVDRGTYAEQETALAEQRRTLDDFIESSAKREDELLQQVLEAEQKTALVESHLQALRDLVNQSHLGTEE